MRFCLISIMTEGQFVVNSGRFRGLLYLWPIEEVPQRAHSGNKDIAESRKFPNVVIAYR